MPLSHLTSRSLTGLRSPPLSLVPAKVQKGPDNTKARKGTTVTLTAEIMGEPPPDVGWTKDGEDIEEDDRQGPVPADKGRAWGWNLGGNLPRNRGEGEELGGKEQGWLISRPQYSCKLTRSSPPPHSFPRVFFEIGTTTTTLTIRRATPQDSGKYEVYVENSLGMDQSFARVDVA